MRRASGAARGPPAWGGGKLNATTVLLEPLAAESARRCSISSATGSTADARARVIAASEGNPLFLEEMAALARERGHVAVPPTIQALLAARLERLASSKNARCSSAARSRARSFTAARSARSWSDELRRARLDRRLAGLVRKELIRPHHATLPDDVAFRFRHLLIRDAAYDGLPKATRAHCTSGSRSWLEEAAATSPSSTRSPAGTSNKRSATSGNSASRRARARVGAPPTICMRQAGAPASAATCRPQRASWSVHSRWRQRMKRATQRSRSTSPTADRGR